MLQSCPMEESSRIYLDKAVESLEGAASEFVNRRFNNTANRSYYACFQAAIHALLQEGIMPPGPKEDWGHDFVQAEFIGQLVNRRKRYPADLRQTLLQNYRLRVIADYERDWVNEIRADRAVRRATEFVEAIRERG